MRTTTSNALFAALAALSACGAPPPGAPRSNESCGSCHAAHGAPFATSAHARASESDLFRAMTARIDPATRSFCDRCHAPHEALGERGVGCVTCHTAIATRGVSNGRLVTGDAEEMLGGFDARATTAHTSRRSAFTRSAELCGTCHEVAGPGALVETPYTEWLASPARAVGVTCADCHMSVTPGTSGTRATGPAASGGPERPLSDHAFVGPEHPRAGELLRRAASMELGVRGREGPWLHVEVTVVNRNAGHALPSGARFAREVWVELVAVDDGGVRHVLSGGLDAAGAIAAGLVPSMDLGDHANPRGAGVPVLDAEPPDVRAVPAGGRRAWMVRVPTTWGGAATVSIAARLRYRRNAWALRAALGLAPDLAAPTDLASAGVEVAR
jgi:nitrate/TMAO reductase-like tetraheme cytochrome c subunit